MKPELLIYVDADNKLRATVVDIQDPLQPIDLAEIELIPVLKGKD